MSSQANANQTRLVTEIIEPFQMMVDERLTGSNVELLRDIYKRADLIFPEIEVYPWVRAYDIAKNTPNTLIFAMVRTQWREPDFVWVGHMATTKYYLYKLRSNDSVALANIQDARKFVLAVVKEAFAHEYFVSKGYVAGENFLTLSDYDTIEKLFFNGKLDLMVSSERFMHFQAGKHGYDASLVEPAFALDELTVDYYLAAHPKTDKTLIEALRRHWPSQPLQY